MDLIPQKIEELKWMSNINTDLKNDIEQYVNDLNNKDNNLGDFE